MVSTSSPGISLRHCLARAERVERLLVAVAVQQRAAPGRRLEAQLEPPRGLLAREKLLEQQGVAGSSLGLRPRQQRRVLVAQGEEAGRLEADHRHAVLDQGGERRERAPRLGARLVDQARREEGPAAAQGTGAAAGRGQVHPIAGARQHALRRRARSRARTSA